MRIAAVLLTTAALLAAPVAASAQPSEVDGALARLAAAEQALARAGGSLSQRRALGQAIRAYEAAMAALGRMDVTLGQEIRTLERALDSARPALRRRLAALSRMGLSATWRVALAETPPADSLRASLVLERLAAQTRAELAEIEEDQAAYAALRDEQAAARTQLGDTRARLIALRDDLIARAEDSAATAGALPDISADADLLAVLAIALSQAVPDQPPAAAALPDPRYAAPLAGRILRGFGARDAAGVARPGLTLEAPAGALVTAPADASVRYLGEIDGYGPVAILEPQAGTLVILAGLGRILPVAGQTLTAGDPVGFLPAAEAHEEFSAGGAEGTGQPSTKTLYIEVRQDQTAVDPAPWFEDLR